MGSACAGEEERLSTEGSAEGQKVLLDGTPGKSRSLLVAAVLVGVAAFFPAFGVVFSPMLGTPFAADLAVLVALPLPAIVGLILASAVAAVVLVAVIHEGTHAAVLWLVARRSRAIPGRYAGLTVGLERRGASVTVYVGAPGLLMGRGWAVAELLAPVFVTTGLAAVVVALGPPFSPVLYTLAAPALVIAVACAIGASVADVYGSYLILREPSGTRIEDAGTRLIAHPAPGCPALALPSRT